MVVVVGTARSVAKRLHPAVTAVTDVDLWPALARSLQRPVLLCDGDTSGSGRLFGFPPDNHVASNCGVNVSVTGSGLLISSEESVRRVGHCCTLHQAAPFSMGRGGLYGATSWSFGGWDSMSTRPASPTATATDDDDDNDDSGPAGSAN